MGLRSRLFCFAGGAVAALLAANSFFAQSAASSTGPLIRQIDHIILASGNAEPLYRLFSEELQLPVAWPFRSYGTFASGGVSLGSINLELLLARQGPHGMTQMALDPEPLSAVLPALDRRAIPHGQPAPYRQKDSAGIDQLLWTTVSMPALSPASTIFLCKYTVDIEERRRRRTAELRQNGGGPLEIDAPVEVVLEVSDLAAAERQWGNLLAPAAKRDGVWHLAGGPAIRLVSSRDNRIALLRIRVKSLQRARASLKQRHLLGLDGEREISLDPSRLAGADIRFVE